MKLDKILAPVDFSETSEVAVRAAVDLARERGALLTLLHVHPIVQAVFLEATLTEPPEEIVEHLNEGEQKLEALRERMAKDVRCDVQVTFGSPVNVIVSSSEEHDLIVMSSHGHSGLTELLLGSVTERVTRGSKCSVWVVKP